MTLADLPADELRAMLARQTRDPGRVVTFYDCATPGCDGGGRRAFIVPGAYAANWPDGTPRRWRESRLAMVDDLIRSADRALGPIYFECNRRAVVAMLARRLMRGEDAARSVRYARAVGNHTLTQRRLDRPLQPATIAPPLPAPAPPSPETPRT